MTWLTENTVRLVKVTELGSAEIVTDTPFNYKEELGKVIEITEEHYRYIKDAAWYYNMA